MKPVEFDNGIIQVDAALVAAGLGIALPQFRKEMRAGRITSVCERGVDADQGRHRITFFSAHRKFRLVIDDTGTVVQRSSVDFGDMPLPVSARKSGR
jgi:hypothetical protein